MATIGKAFTFRVYCSADHMERSFEFILDENGWSIGDVRKVDHYDPYGPRALAQSTNNTPLLVPESTRHALALLHENQAGLSDRIFQTRLSTIATSMSGILKDTQPTH
jgi:hypothetical protein